MHACRVVLRHHAPAVRRWLGHAVTAVAIVGITSSAAAQDEKPVITEAFANAPGQVTLVWEHSGEDVYGFVIERVDPLVFIWAPDQDKRAWTIPQLSPSTTYRFRVCAVFAFNRKCSDEDGVGPAIVTTMDAPPPPQPGPAPRPPTPGPAPAPVPIALFAPTIRALPYRMVRSTTPMVHLRWTNPINEQQRALLTEWDWYRNGQPFHRSGYLLVLPDPGGSTLAKYKLCIGNRVNRICSNEIEASPTGVPASLRSNSQLQSYVRHRNALGEVTRLSNELDSRDASFVIRPGLDGSPTTVSFSSVNRLGHYLRHQNFRVKLHAKEDTALFARDASFVPQWGLFGAPNGVSFQASGMPGYFLIRRNEELWIARNDDTRKFASNATFIQDATSRAPAPLDIPPRPGDRLNDPRVPGPIPIPPRPGDRLNDPRVPGPIPVPSGEGDRLDPRRPPSLPIPPRKP